MRNDTLVAIFTVATDTKDLNEEIIGFNAYPSPTAGELTISYKMRSASKVSLSLKNALGQDLAQISTNELVNADLSYEKQINMKSLGATGGVYYIVLRTEDNQFSKKVLFVE